VNVRGVMVHPDWIGEQGYYVKYVTVSWVLLLDCVKCA
jgi:hypothetical protein